MKTQGVMILIIFISLVSIIILLRRPVEYSDFLRIHEKQNIQIKSTNYNYANYNDPYLDRQWGYFTVGANLAHANDVNGTNKLSPSNPIVVAVIDSGVDYTHPDLANNYLHGGYDFINNDNDPMDDNGHGTHCAGIIAAEANNSIGISGIAPCAKIIAYKVIDASGYAYIDDFTRDLSLAFHHILTYHHPAINGTHGVDVISMSLGALWLSSIYETSLINNISAAVTAGITVLAAAGNYGDYLPGWVLYPAAYSDVIAISATDIFQGRASYSSYGSEVEYAAPGGDFEEGFLFYPLDVGILSTYPGNKYKLMSGTSMAAPMAAGIVALLLGNGTSPSSIKNELTARAKPLGSPIPNDYFGYGLCRICPNNWDYNAWFDKYYGESIFLQQISFLLFLFGDMILPQPSINPIIIIAIACSIAVGIILPLYLYNRFKVKEEQKSFETPVKRIEIPHKLEKKYEKDDMIREIKIKIQNLKNKYKNLQYKLKNYNLLKENGNISYIAFLVYKHEIETELTYLKKQITDLNLFCKNLRNKVK
ncbi:MAG: S8 family serine peptidase [Candidatus Helarchaeota archaeon]|nr:S8 family serine peptidase [Candidatus Helarchaeota archaeon]